VREAIISLEIAGFVEVRVGSGIFVRRPSARSASQEAANDAGPGPFELLSARVMIEGEIAAVAARHARKSDLQRLRATIERMRLHDDDFTGRDAADREFHERLAAMTGNDALVWIVGSMWDQRRSDLWRRTEDHFHTPELRARTLVDHEAIVAAVEARDPEGARAAMREHLSRVAREFRRRIEADAVRERRGTRTRQHSTTVS
jgi:DNA-binding FadR family transcriptional regulator